MLAPLSAIYKAVIQFRNGQFDRNKLATYNSPVPVISVGNLTAGGTGKTPHVSWLADALLAMNRRPGILSRGYGRLSHGYQLVSDGRNILIDAGDAGDEPLLLARRHRVVPVAVDGKRSRGIGKLISGCHVDCILLDDAFQHRQVSRDLDIVLLNAQEPESHYRLLPQGRLREPWTALERTDLIIISKARGLIPAHLEQALLQFSGKPILLSEMEMQLLQVDNSGFSPVTRPPSRLLAFCGIADPGSFQTALHSQNISPVWFRSFRDHRRYFYSDLKKLASLITQENGHGFITTEKDLVKLPREFLDTHPVYILRMSVKLTDRDQDVLLHLLHAAVSDRTSDNPNQENL